ncbi:ATP-dependent helicase [Roseinatronobacter sp.]|uniref:ATP-dependent helicase n=1 Tax=Roseinatronobacter sp. TaxID=1945755 RepID=UPI003F72293D
MRTAPNASQNEVIHALDGPVLVVAGPGSGKTFCLVERIAKILQTRGIDPGRILVSTFTEKAAKELVTRISRRLGGQASIGNPLDLNVGTLHSIFLRLLEEFRAYTSIQKNYTVLDQFDQQYFIFQHAAEFRCIEKLDDALGLRGPQSSWNFAGTLLSWLNKISEEGITADALSESDTPELSASGKAYQLYQRLLTEYNFLDFSTIQVEMLRLLDTPEVCTQIQGRFDYIMIDEYQDTNSIQERIVLKLAQCHKNLCVVGDDDQALYRFRGASIRNILEFPERFTPGECKQIRLTKNYRSEPPIIDFYNHWMNTTDWMEGERSFRFDKQIEPAKPRTTPYPSVFKVSGQDGAENWADETLQFLSDLRSKGIIKDWNQEVIRQPEKLMGPTIGDRSSNATWRMKHHEPV